MAQTSILGRIGQLVRANVNSILDGAEDPEKMLDQLIRDFTNNIAEAEEAVAQTVGNLRLLEDDAREAREASARVAGQGHAPPPTAPRRCAARATPPRPTASTAWPSSPSAARSASTSRSRPSTRRSPSRPSSPTSSRTASTSCASSARSWSRSATSWSAAPRWPRPRSQVQETLKERLRHGPDVASSTASRRRSAARRPWPAAWRRSATSSLEDQFAELESGEDDLEVEARLAELKARWAPAPRRSARARPRPDLTPRNAPKGSRERPLLAVRAGERGSPCCAARLPARPRLG